MVFIEKRFPPRTYVSHYNDFRDKKKIDYSCKHLRLMVDVDKIHILRHCFFLSSSVLIINYLISH